jgi:hypothetical protein
MNDPVRISVLSNCNIEVVGDPAAADHGGKLLEGHQLVDQPVVGVGGHALGGVDGGGVSELDRFPDVCGG